MDTNRVNILITKPTINDVEGIQDVFYRTWIDTYPNEEHGILREDIEYRFKDYLSEERLEKRRAQIGNLPDNEKFFIAKDADKNLVVGAMRLLIHPDHNQLQAIYVLPEYQRMGIGRSLWEKAEEIFNRNLPTKVEVVTYNTKAITFYERLGFVDTGRRFSELTMRNGRELPELEMIRK